MSEARTQPPFRMPCEGVAGRPKFFFGPPFQHAVAPVLRDKYTNTTTVDNWNTGVGGTIGPYERWTPDPGGPASCDVHHCVEDGAPCSAWPLPVPANTYSHTDSDQVNFAVARKRGFKAVQARRFWSGVLGYLNQETSGGPDTTQACGDCTYKRWRGYNATVDGTKYLTIDITAEDTEWQDNYDEFGNFLNKQVNWDDSISLSESINPNSGILTCTYLSANRNSSDNKALSAVSFALWTWAEIVNYMTTNKLSPVGSGTITCTDTSITVTSDDGSGPLIIEYVTWDLGAGTFDRKQYQNTTTGEHLVILEESITVATTSFTYTEKDYTYTGAWAPPYKESTGHTLTVTGTLSGANTSASIYTDIKENLLSLWPLNDDALYPWRTDIKVSAAPLVTRDELQTTAFNAAPWIKDYSNPIADDDGSTLGDHSWSQTTGLTIAPDPNSGTTKVSLGGKQSNGDGISTGAGNPMGFTTVTGYTYVGLLPPGCTFDATTGTVSGTCTADCTWGITVTITGAAAAATGNILGAPKPAGYQNYFDFNYRDWAGCCYQPPDNPGFQTWSWYQLGWGMDVTTFNSNAGCQLPLNATQWANYFQSVNKPQGAWLFYNDPGQAYYGQGCVSSDAPSGTLDGDALWACKYAECGEQFYSENFARPAGDDKFSYDENHVYCVTNAAGSGAGSTWNVTSSLDGSTPPDTTDFSGIWGGASVGGFYNVSGYSGGILTLGSKVANTPSNWASKSHGDDAQCFGKLRFSTAPALLGRVAITPDVAGTTFTFVSAQPNFGMDASSHQEQVDLYDAAMTLLHSNVTATRVDDTHFTVPSGSAAVSAAFVMIHGAPAWYMNDTDPKGDYALLQWLADYRSIGEYNRLAGVTDCSSAQVTQPTANAGGGPVANAFASFSQTPGCLPFVPCAPRVVCISPNGESFPNGITYGFPDTFACDEQYGCKWWAFVQWTMTDLFWQPPHRPCNIESCAQRLMDSGSCADDQPADGAAYACPGDDGYVEGESATPTYYYAHAPQVEARLTVPCNYGMAQNECAPNLPAGIQIGWLSPVNNSTGDVALPPNPPGALSDHGEPAGASTTWAFHDLLCAAAAAGCRFNYTLPGC